MADSSFRRELVRAALPAAIAVVGSTPIADAPGLADSATFAQSAANLAILIAKKTDEAYDKLVEAERAIEILAGK